MAMTNIKNALAGVAVKDLDSAVSWYQQLLGAKPSRPMTEVAEWGFEHGGWLQIFTDPERAGHSSVTLSVDSIDEARKHLLDLGIDIPIEHASDVVETVIIKDPDGNQIVFAEAKTGKLAQ